MTQPQRPARGKAWLTAGTTLAALLFVVLLFPSARALAGGIVQRIGGYGFTSDPSQVAPVQKQGQSGSVGIVKSQDSVSVQVTGEVPTAHDVAGASQLAGFTVLAPSYLPAGFSAMSDWLVAPQGSGMIATKGYRDATNHFFMINEWRAGDSPEQDYARNTIVNVTVHGQPGVYLPSPVNAAGRKDALVWAENGITYSLITDSLSQAEMMQVAEGLGQ